MERSFSDRLGITKPPALQLNEMSDALRNSLWNILHSLFGGDGAWRRLARALAALFFKVRVDKVPDAYDYQAKEWVAAHFFVLPWYEVYNLIQMLRPYLPTLLASTLVVEKYDNAINEVLEREAAGYRFLKGELAPITNTSELASIQEALDAAMQRGLPGVHTHLSKAVTLLSQKPKADHHNSIKEAITAVEAAANLIGGTSKSGLDGPLNNLANQVSIHPAMKDAFLKLYGYTSSKEGIRHPMLEKSGVGFDEAKFMLVACSAFVNFLISKAAAARMLKKA